MRAGPSSFRPSRRHLLGTIGVVAGGTALGALGIRPTPAAAKPDVGGASYDPAASVNALRTGIDYAWSKPRPSAIAAAGYTFVCRYVSWDTTGKNLTASETQSLVAAGIDVVTNWEYNTNEALDGYSAGASNAREAQRQAL